VAAFDDPPSHLSRRIQFYFWLATTTERTESLILVLGGQQSSGCGDKAGTIHRSPDQRSSSGRTERRRSPVPRISPFNDFRFVVGPPEHDAPRKRFVRSKPHVLLRCQRLPVLARPIGRDPARSKTVHSDIVGLSYRRRIGLVRTRRT
jgi:hypothetical protein